MDKKKGSVKTETAAKTEEVAEVNETAEVVEETKVDEKVALTPKEEKKFFKEEKKNLKKEKKAARKANGRGKAVFQAFLITVATVAVFLIGYYVGSDGLTITIENASAPAQAVGNVENQPSDIPDDTLPTEVVTDAEGNTVLDDDGVALTTPISDKINGTSSSTKAPVSAVAQKKDSKGRSMPTSSAQIVKYYNDVLSAYKKDANSKGPASEATFVQYEFQELQDKKFDGIVMEAIGAVLPLAVKTEDQAEKYYRKGSMHKIPMIDTDSIGCWLTEADISRAIKSASCTEITDGEYKGYYKVVIALKDEKNPDGFKEIQNADGSKSYVAPKSFTGRMFNVIDINDINKYLDPNVDQTNFDSLEKALFNLGKLVTDPQFELVYTGCSSTIIVNPEKMVPVEINQDVGCKINIPSGKLGLMKLTGSATYISHYWVKGISKYNSYDEAKAIYGKKLIDRTV